VTSRIGRPWDVQEIHLSVISLSGTVDEEEDEFTLFWK
jgi:phenol hydroxylase P2 protein